MHLKKLLNQWGLVTKIDQQSLKLMDLSKIRLKVEMKANVVLLALLEVRDGGMDLHSFSHSHWRRR